MKSEISKFIPVLSCEDAKRFEKNFFARGTMTEESAMSAAGTAVGDAILRKCPATYLSRLLVLAGKGHNGGDAVCAATRIFSKTQNRIMLVFFAENENALAPLTKKFLDQFLAVVPEERRGIFFFSGREAGLPKELLSLVATPHAVLDGIFGHSFRPPFPPEWKPFLNAIMRERTRDSVCYSVDLPSGLCDAGDSECVIRADRTFPTGILKTPLLENPELAGQIEPLEIGFPVAGQEKVALANDVIFLRRILKKRPVYCDKRDFGHVLIIGGSRSMPGAVLLNALAALRAGAGLVSVICPERVQAAFAARAPGAMWIPCRENDEGGLDCDSALTEFRRLLPRVSAVLCGSGMGISENAQTLVREIISAVPKSVPLILDADALRIENLAVLEKRGAPPENTVLTPHAGEFSRLGGDSNSPENFCRKHSVSLVLKGVCTRIVGAESSIFTFSGSPVLARGGSGDVLAGMLGAMLASEKNFCPDANMRERLAAAVVWHGLAARALADARGERCADISALPEFFFECLGGRSPS